MLKGLLFFLVVIDNIQGFPSSVTPDYVPFQIWDLLQVIKLRSMPNKLLLLFHH